MRIQESTYVKHCTLCTYLSCYDIYDIIYLHHKQRHDIMQNMQTQNAKYAQPNTKCKIYKRETDLFKIRRTNSLCERTDVFCKICKMQKRRAKLHSSEEDERQRRRDQGRNLYRDSLFWHVHDQLCASISCDERNIAASH